MNNKLTKDQTSVSKKVYTFTIIKFRSRCNDKFTIISLLP